MKTTTVWQHWDGSRPAAPNYAKVRTAPQPDERLNSLSTSKEVRNAKGISDVRKNMQRKVDARS